MKLEKNKVATVDYTLKLNSGNVVDSSEASGPIKFIAGCNQINTVLEDSLLGMQQGEKKTITLKPEEAYGQRNESLFQKIEKSMIPDEIELKKGLILTATRDNGEKINVTIVDFDDSTVTLDLNHPLAGETLKYETEISEIRDATSEEIKTNQVH